MIECSYTDSDPVWMAVQKQVARLQGLPKFPAGSDAKRELCLALAHANSIAEAVFIVDRVVQSDSTEHCPSPPDIRRMINAEHERGRDMVGEITRGWKLQDVPAPPGLKQRLDRHLDVLNARMVELNSDRTLNRIGLDGRKIQTPLRDQLAALTDELR